MRKKVTVILFDGGYKDAAPALLSLANQTILDDIQVLWVEFYDKVFGKVTDYPFVTQVKLNRPKGQPFHVSYCFNAGLLLAEGKYLCVVDPCLWFQPNVILRALTHHRKNSNSFTSFIEARDRGGKIKDFRFRLEKEYFPVFSQYNVTRIKWHVRNTNRGCLPMFPTKMCRELNGFDIYHGGGMKGKINDLCDRPSVGLCYWRMINKFNIKVVELKSLVYHAWHPTDKEVLNRGFNRKISKEYRESGRFRAEKGLEYMESRFKIRHTSSNIVDFEEV